MEKHTEEEKLKLEIQQKRSSMKERERMGKGIGIQTKSDMQAIERNRRTGRKIENIEKHGIIESREFQFFCKILKYFSCLKVF